jgi:Flp pilus assembly protein TadG
MRRAALAVESAYTLLVLFAILMITVVGGYGVLRYQEMAMLAREGARYAVVHGTQYAQSTGNTAATDTDVLNNGILPYTVNLDTTQLSCTVTWGPSNTPTTSTSDYEKGLTSTVTVTVSYQWFPELFLVGPFTLSSSSTLPMAF